MSGAEVVWQLNKKYISHRSTFTSTCQLTSLYQIGIMAYCMYLTWFKKENKVQMKYMRKRQKKRASRHRAHGHDNVYTSSRAQNRVFVPQLYERADQPPAPARRVASRSDLPRTRHRSPWSRFQLPSISCPHTAENRQPTIRTMHASVDWPAAAFVLRWTSLEQLQGFYLDN